MYQITYTAQQLRSLKSKGAQYLTICAHDIGTHTKGDVVSWHKSHDAAQRAAKPHQYVAVYDINDAIFDAEARSL